MHTNQSQTISHVADNGHFRHRSQGETTYEGELENLPMPAGPMTTAEAVQAMYEDGYVIFRGVLNRSQVSDLRIYFDAQGGPDEKYVVKGWCFNKALPLDFPNDPKLLEYIDKPGIIEVVDAIHEVPDFVKYGHAGGGIVTGGNMWITGQGRKMGMHVDFQAMTLPESVYDDPEVHIPIFGSTAHFYLNDMQAELGPTIVIPGSHKAGRFPENQTSWHDCRPKAVMVNAGDVMLFRSDIWHGAWLNTSKECRYMMQIFYAAAFMTRGGFPPMKYDKYWSQAVLDKATPRQRRLLGADPQKIARM